MSTAAFTTPWKPGAVPVIRLRGRSDRQLAQAAVPRTETIAPRVALAQDVVLDEATIAEMLLSDNQQTRRLALNALNDRMQLFGDLLTGRSTIQLSSEALFPDGKNAGLPEAIVLSDVIRQSVDTRWTALFNMQDRRSEPWPGYFKVVDLYHSISVDEYLPGERIKLGFVEKGENIYEHSLFGTGIQWNMLEMAGRYERAEALATMQIKWANKLAKLAYEVVTAASGISTTSYDATGASVLEKDIRTINAAMLEIRKALFEATAADGSGTGAQQVEEIIQNATFYLLYNDHTTRYEDRVNDALNTRFTTSQGGGTTISEINRPIIPIGSPYVPTGNWYIGIAGRKNIFSTLRDLRFYDFNDPRIAGVGEGEVGWGVFKFLRGDVRQWRKLALS